ncbi:short-chain dehydrogenase/reductase SDR [Spiroplasma syrphidicola EA-1]|uniref:Short-chain dehydrogenase/reductase SDR n=1 Tax=Spiroplasma syrphidicola EA-1 TaxID=1276229 RepID=R4UJD8_9MOLU|nr:oxidoreductase [Spiroplasma syrphidicola]AGM26245.1 short-chain dehydrogenase/reductase SDR [Spiroplasma syrphidicola EA-1]
MKQQKVAVVTGASSGIGKVIAIELSKAGYLVYGLARRLERMEAELKPFGIIPVQVDVTDDPSIVAAITNIITKSGRIDVLVNNAGYGLYGTIEDTNLAEARQQFEVNLFALARVTQLVLPQMRAQKSGHIFNLSSIMGVISHPVGGWYAASKFAVEGLSNSLRLETRKFGIKVVVIEPGAIKSEWSHLAAETLAKTAETSAYQAEINLALGMLPGPDFGHDPIVIAKLITKALHKRHPKARYHAGYLAGRTLWVKRHLSDKHFDNIMMRSLAKLARKQAKKKVKRG